VVDLRQKAFNNISKILAITRYDIEQRQLINDYGLNIHAENYFRDIFNFIYGYSLENANFENQNIAHIDLIDKTNKLLYQITTTRTKEKIENTLKALNSNDYVGYSIKIFYLLDKANPNKDTELEVKYNIVLKDILLDYTDLIKDINNLETNKLIELNSKYFSDIEKKYTEEIVLNLVFKHLIQNHSKIKPNYDDDLGSIDTNKKIEINSLNKRITNKINDGLDYIAIVNDINSEDNLLSELRNLVIEDLYKNILINLLISKVSKSELENKTLVKLHSLSKSHNLDFNKIINNLHISLENKIDIKDFNSTSISWIIIAYFFEICDVGIKQ
jgi:hypothetical protein